MMPRKGKIMLEKLMYGWLFFAALFIFASVVVCTLVLIFCDLFLLHNKENNIVTIYCERWLQFLTDEERMAIIILYPIAYIGKYFLEYVPAIIILLEYIFIFWLFKFPFGSDLGAILAEFLLVMTGVLCAFKATKFLISLYDSFYRKMPVFMHRQHQSIWDNTGYIFSLLIIGGGIVVALLDENSLVSGLIRWVNKGLSKMSAFSVFLLAVVLICITYQHIKESLIQREQEKKKEQEEKDDEEEEESGFWLQIKKRRRRNKRPKKNKK